MNSWWRPGSGRPRDTGRALALVLGVVIGLWSVILIGFALVARVLGVPTSIVVQGCARTKNSRVCMGTDPLRVPHRLFGDYYVHTLDQLRVHLLPGHEYWAFVDGSWTIVRPLIIGVLGGLMVWWAARDGLRR